jgi:hypothetical protein
MKYDEYVDMLLDMDEFRHVPRERLEECAARTYDWFVPMLKPSLYYAVVRRPWNFICRPFNRLLRWIGCRMPLYDAAGEPMNDQYIHLSACLKMAGYVPFQEYGWHVVDARSPGEMDADRFRRHFRSMKDALEGLPCDIAINLLEQLYEPYAEKRHIPNAKNEHRRWESLCKLLFT